MDMDGQKSAHGKGYAYASPYWAEFYDMWVEEIIGSAALARDDDFFFNLRSPFLSSSSSVRKPRRVVDMATGTGRVIQGLLRKMDSLAQGEVPNEERIEIEIWGIDHSQAMIDRAKSLLDDKTQPSTMMVWRTSTAASFVDDYPELQNAVDLVIFAAGSIGHLTAQGERVRFLRQVVKALRNTNLSQTPPSVAAISILKHENDMENKSFGHDVPIDEVPSSAEMRKPSRQWPHFEYRKSETTASRNGGTNLDSFNLKVIETATGKIVSQKEYSWSLTVFSEEEWEKELSDCGFSINQKVETGSEIWYLLHMVDEKNPQ